MGKRLVGLSVAIALASNAFGDDKIGTTKAPEILKKVASELSKKKGYHVTEQTVLPQVPGGGGGGGLPSADDLKFEGIVKKDCAALKGGAEAWCKGALILIRTKQGKYVEVKELSDDEKRIAGAVRNPAVIIADIFRFGGASSFTGEETIQEIDCKIAETWADQKTAEEHLKEVVKFIPIPKQFAGNMDITQFLDKKKSSSAYKAWVGKETLLFHRVEWTITAVIDKGKIPGGYGDRLPDKVELKIELVIKDYDKDLEIEVPKEITAKLGWKEEPKKEEKK